MIVYPNAKINIGLNITERRSDGYHNIETVFYPIAINDILEIVFPKEQNGEYIWKQSGNKLDCSDDNNICIKALRLLRENFKLPTVGMFLIKNIPSGAGLGGGSADGAFVLSQINRLCNLGMNNDELCAMAAKLGADCAFFINNTPCYATGIGDKLTPINLNLSGKYICVIKPDIHVSTAEAYAGVTPHKPNISVADIVSRPITEWRNLLINDFEATVFAKHAEIKEIKEFLYQNGALYASMSGSGSAVYGIFDKMPTCKWPNSFNYSGLLS